MTSIPAISVNRKKIFFSNLENISINGSFPFTPTLLSSLTKTICEIIKNIRVLGDELTNQRGRDPNGELFYLQGLLPKEEEDVSSKTGNLVEYTLNSTFSRFDDRRSLIEKIIETKSINCPEWINLDNIYKIAPFYPKELRFGLQYYKQAHISSMLGIAPKMVARILIDANDSRCELLVEDRSKKNSDELIYSTRVFKDISRYFSNIAGPIMGTVTEVSPQNSTKN